MFEFIAMVIRGIASFFKDRAPTVSDVANGFAAFVEAGEPGLDDLEMLTKQIKGLVERNEDPTEVDFAVWKARIADAADRAQAVLDELDE